MSKMPDRYDAAEAWAKERVGKRVYRAELGCQCRICKDVAANGMLIVDEMHAVYITDCAMEMGYRYQDEPINECGQVEAGSGVRSLSGAGMLAGGTEVEPPVVDPGNGTSGGEGGGGVQNVLG